MDSVDMFKLLKAEDELRFTNEPIVIGGWSMDYLHRNSFVEELLEGKIVTLHDGSTLFMVLDNVETFRAGYNGERSTDEDQWGAWGADAKAIIVRHEAPGGYEQTYWKLDIYDDSWDNAYTDEWTFGDINEIDWKG